MAMDPESVGAASKFVDWILGAVGGLVAIAVSGVSWLYKNLYHRVSVLENTAMRKDDFQRFEDRAEQTRKEFRDGIIGVHTKMETVARDLEDKIDSLIKHLLEHK